MVIKFSHLPEHIRKRFFEVLRKVVRDLLEGKKDKIVIDPEFISKEFGLTDPDEIMELTYLFIINVMIRYTIMTIRLYTPYEIVMQDPVEMQHHIIYTKASDERLRLSEEEMNFIIDMLTYRPDDVFKAGKDRRGLR